ncbi:kynureninase [Mycena floridula]|nr:kynureninase [Mycena floridula]
MNRQGNLALSSEFFLPTNAEIGATRRFDELDKSCIYLCGNSLGPLSQRSKALVEEEMQVWASRAVVGHFSHPLKREWVDYVSLTTPLLAELIGAHESEVACMGTLTANLHLLMNSFYKPTTQRFKILCEVKAFPSDQYAFASQVIAHGLDPSEAILEISPRAGEHTLREEDIIAALDREGSSIALVLFSGVQYYTGQWFGMENITRKAKEQGCICGWDLAHAIGNVPMFLHDWDVDFAVWCTYKYLNAGPGSIGGLFVHEKWNEGPKFAGWWGHDPKTRFKMPPRFSPIDGAQGFQQSNPSILAAASLLGSLQIFKEIGMPAIRERSLILTKHLEDLLRQSPYYEPTGIPGFTIITPKDPDARGAQLSLLFLPVGSGTMQKIFDLLVSYGVIGDERHPDVIRLAPIGLYNTVKDCEEAVLYLSKAFEEIQN